ncbi:MAG: molybdenum cofactor guanylyltransferase [Candidatus Eremiobacteraeota bacterium]|nr:molybdenum cofactor guanylyltransferase [Candidatus Eremiobacteraeota bacterium]MBV8354442.1 molybdenum cofactor guanylyltransferase [Candidatus Eremiobacteraeota bacterium]
MAAETPQIGVLILAGGEATRLPNKLTLAAGDVPMIVRVYRNTSAGRVTFISTRTTFPPEIDALLDCPMVVDRWARRGPLCGMLSAMPEMPTPLVFAVAGDAPLIDAAFIERVAQAWRPGDEAVVPARLRDGREQLEPLAALYDRRAFLREGPPVLEDGDGGVLSVLARLRVRKIALDPADAERVLVNVNTPSEYAALAERL